MIQVSAPGKMILLGEYAVLEDAPALVCAVKRRASVRIYPGKGNEFSIRSTSLNIGWQPFILTPHRKIRFDPNISPVILNKLHFFSDIFESIFEALKVYGSLPFVGIELETDAFYSHELHRKLGFGSSSALTTALTKGMAEAADLKLTDREIFSLALNAHRAAQGKAGSGIDIAACTYGSVLEYKREQVPQKILPWKELPLAVVWTGASASTRKMVQSVSALKVQRASLYAEIMEQLSRFSEQGISAYRERRMEAFLTAAQNFYNALKRLGNESNTSIISKPHRELAEMAARHGLVYKPSGAGGGDIGLLFASSFETLEKVKIKVAKAGYKIIDVEISADGVSVDLLK